MGTENEGPLGIVFFILLSIFSTFMWYHCLFRGAAEKYFRDKKKVMGELATIFFHPTYIKIVITIIMALAWLGTLIALFSQK